VSGTYIFLAVALSEPEKDRIVQLSTGTNAVAPEILPYEIGNALSALHKRKQITLKEALSAQKAANRIPVRLVAIDIQQALKLAIEFNIYAYDAYFLECAKSLSCPLITLDNRMKRVAVELNIETLEQIEMKVFTYSEARQNLSKLLTLAQKEEIEILRKDGSVFSLTSKNKVSKSPFDISGIKTKVTTQNIIDAVRDSRMG
jgi:predicted nucleic acid-binding protein